MYVRVYTVERHGLLPKVVFYPPSDGRPEHPVCALSGLRGGGHLPIRNAGKYVILNPRGRITTTITIIIVIGFVRTVTPAARFPRSRARRRTLNGKSLIIAPYPGRAQCEGGSVRFNKP